MNEKYENIIQGIMRYLEQHPDFAEECSVMVGEPGLSSVGKAAKKIADAMDAYNWVEDVGPREWTHAVNDAVYRVCPHTKIREY